MIRRNIIFMLAVGAVAGSLFVASANAESMKERVDALKPYIGSYPPSVKDEAELASIKNRYFETKRRLDDLISKNGNDLELLFERGRLQCMGHNMDLPGAHEGATQDLTALLKRKPEHVPALLALGTLWVNSDPARAGAAEKLFRAAQCYDMNRPLEQAQSGIFFALYYQGKMQDAFRQSRYLVQTWPENDAYRALNETTRAVLLQNGNEKSVQEISSSKASMARCPNR